MEAKTGTEIYPMPRSEEEEEDDDDDDAVSIVFMPGSKCGGKKRHFLFVR
jgi:hypothetical protein